MEKKKFNKKLLIKISILVVCLILSVPLVILPASTVIVYEMIFSMRFETQPYQMQEVSDYEGLTVERSDFKSDVTIAGYKYSKPNQEAKGLVIISHGLGDGGHNKFMGYIDEFTSNGYYVFTYDAQGTDNSGGSSSSGFPQGIIDLDNAIDHAKEIEEYKGLPIMLFGHSWGAYSVGNVLNHHPEVSAAVMVAGFNESEEMMGYYPRKVLGGFVDVVLLPYVSFYERVKFGKDYASITAVAQCRHLLPLPQGCGAHHLRSVVREDEASCQGSHPCGQGRGDQVRSRALLQDLYELDGECP